MKILPANKKIDVVNIEVSSNVLAKNVFLSLAQYTFYSNNYFDVLPNQKVKISLSKPVEKIEVKSSFDTMK